MRLSYNIYRAIASPADRSPVGALPTDPVLILHRPELKVRVSGPGKGSGETVLWGLVDTGAVECILPHAASEVLRPIWRGYGSHHRLHGRGEAVRYGQVFLQIRIGHKQIRWPAIVAFSRDREEAALWGRRGFLDHFSVTFNGPGSSSSSDSAIRSRPGSRSRPSRADGDEDRKASA